jgi:copper chaperone
MKSVFIVKDMNCGHCKRRIEEALAGSEGVDSFEVDLPGKKVAVESALDAGVLAGIIAEAGYTPSPA